MQPEASVRQPFELVEQLREDAEVAAPSELEAPPSRVIIRRDGEESLNRASARVYFARKTSASAKALAHGRPYSNRR